jgi:serine/threonine-protein kinase SRPK3
MLDKWAFGMSKIDGEDGKPASVGSSGSRVGGFVDAAEKARRADSTELALAAENISISAPDTFGSKTLNPQPAVLPGPSLLTQQAPSHTNPIVLPTSLRDELLAPLDCPAVEVPLSSSAVSVDSLSISGVLEPITVKIADLGNGE